MNSPQSTAPVGKPAQARSKRDQIADKQTVVVLSLSWLFLFCSLGYELVDFALAESNIRTDSVD
jgi:hypothetical protein